MSRFRYKQLLPLLVALILPTVVIALLGWKNAAKEQELSEKRLMDARKQTIGAIRQEILARLERIKLQEIAAAPVSPAARPSQYSDPAVVFVGWADRDRLILPWEADSNPGRFRQSIEAPEFARKIAEAERAELGEKQYERAAALYRESIASAEAGVNQSRIVYARFRLARTLARSETNAEALRIYRDLLNLPTNIVDESGIPFASYAAKRLLDFRPDPSAEREVLNRMKREIESSAIPAPAWIYVFKGILETLRQSADPGIKQEVEKALVQLSDHVKYLEQAQALQAEFSSLRLTPVDWQLYSASEDESWLLGLTPARGESKPLLIAVRAGKVFEGVSGEHLSPGSEFQFRISAGSGEPLGENLPGLRIDFLSSEGAGAKAGLDLQQSFYVLSLALVIGLTFVGGYLMWRDTRREVRIAELRSQFVSSVSHELKTPLTSIRMFAETLQMAGTPDPKTQAEYLDIIVTETERLTRLLNNVLDFSRIERGQKNYHMESALLPDVVDAAVRTMQFPLSEQGFELRVNVCDGIPPIKVDRDAIEQAILNLLSNAMKYSGKSKDIELRLCSQNGTALIQVADHGIGIPATEQHRIFEKFYRVPSRENRVISGTGLGLALVSHIAEAHGGKVEVESIPGEGSTFSIHLPIPAGDHA